MRYLAIFSLTIVVFLTSCSTSKRQYLNNYEELMDEVAQNHQSFDHDEWNNANEEFKILVEEYYPEYEEEMTDEEKVRFWTQAFTFQVLQHKERVFEEFEENEEVYVQLMEENARFIDEISDQVIEDVLPELERVLPELNEIGKEFVQRLEEKGTLDKMKRSLEDFGERMEEISKQLEEDSSERRTSREY
ncbi:MAG: hypothetical protein KDE26_17155 [Bacteroidetes bacterium]|nr:hypothetical protein [Bacteroidota bacterium]